MMEWSELVPLVQPHVPGCPEPIIETYLHRGGWQLCRDAHCWKERVAAVYPYEGQRYYQLYLPNGAQVVALARATQKEDQIRATVNMFGALELAEPPKESRGEIEVELILQPGPDAPGLPDRIGNDYSQALISFALHQLMIMPGKDWTSPEMAAYHLQQYNETVDQARYRRRSGNSEQDRRVTPVWFV